MEEEQDDEAAQTGGRAGGRAFPYGGHGEDWSVTLQKRQIAVGSFAIAPPTSFLRRTMTRRTM